MVICGSEAVTGWKQGADQGLIPEPEKVLAEQAPLRDPAAHDFRPAAGVLEMAEKPAPSTMSRPKVAIRRHAGPKRKHSSGECTAPAGRA